MELFVKDSLWYGLSTFFVNILTLFLIKLHTAYLDSGEYGLLALIEMAKGFFFILCECGFSASVLRYYEKYDSGQDKRRVVFTAIVFLAVTGAAFLLVSIATAEPLATSLLGAVDDGRSLIIIAAATVVFSVFNSVLFSLMRIRSQSRRLAAILTLKTFSMLVLNAVLLAHFDMAIAGVLLASLMAETLVCVIIAPGAIVENYGSFDSGMLKDMLGYGVPLVPHSMSKVALSMADRFILALFLTMPAVGLYSLGYKVASIVLSLMGPVQKAWAPFVFRAAGDRQMAGRIGFTALCYMLLICTVGLGLSLFAREVTLLLSSGAYIDAYRIVPVVVAGFLWLALYNIVSWEMGYTEKTSYFPLITGVSAVVNVLLNMALIPIYGIAGAAWATLLAYAVSALMAYRISRSLIATRYRGLYTAFSVVMVTVLGVSFIEELDISVKVLMMALWLAFSFRLIASAAEEVFSSPLGLLVKRFLGGLA